MGSYSFNLPIRALFKNISIIEIFKTNWLQNELLTGLHVYQLKLYYKFIKKRTFFYILKKHYFCSSMRMSINGKFTGEKRTLSYWNSINYHTNVLELLPILKFRDLSFQKSCVMYVKYYTIKKSNSEIVIYVWICTKVRRLYLKTIISVRKHEYNFYKIYSLVNESRFALIWISII